MESEYVLTQLRGSAEPPHGWIVFPLLRSKVIMAICGWVFGALLGLGLFAGLASISIPYNYQQGTGPAIISTLLMGLMLFIGLGSVWSLIADVRRLRRLDKHVIVITPEDFVKQEGEKVIHVPLMYVRHVTARGTPPPSHSYDRQDGRIHSSGENFVGFFAGRGFTSSGMRWRRKRMRTPTTLAFVDMRTDQEVIVANDSAYGDTFMIAALLKQYAASVQHIA